MSDQTAQTSSGFASAASEALIAEHLENCRLRREMNRLRDFILEISNAPDAMVCRLTRDAAKQVLEGNNHDR